MFDSFHCWYEVEPARTSRSKCKEFRCKETIVEGELRIGIKQDFETDHFGDCMGWYHPACLWKTFTYKTNANPRVEKPEDLRGYSKLNGDEKAIIKDLIKNGGNSASYTSSSPAKAKKGGKKFKLTMSHLPNKKVEGESIFNVSGNTFDCKDQLKSFGAKWDFDNKSWNFTKENAERLLSCLNITELPEFGKSVQIEMEPVESETLAPAASPKKETTAKTTGKKNKKDNEESKQKKKRVKKKHKDSESEEDDDDYDDDD